ncbi:MAG: glycosyl hydrolase [Caldivirga sp.]|uniref:glycosyl hydrolase n=1 Tax=Caldivirga sp. TaxID=2080243 RepID=UPI003D111DFE
MLSESDFKNPPTWFRGVPFWSINDKLNSDELVRQLRLLINGGFGGGFFHAREGLLTPFLSDEWFKALKATVEAASREGGFIWLYDEDRWPSGFAGGHVPALGPEHRARSIVMVINATPFKGSDVMVVFKCAPGDGLIPRECWRINEGKAEDGYLYLSFIRHVASPGEPWYGGFSYVDLLNSSTVDKFIEIAYKPHVEALKEYVGKVVPGIFTDEPNLTSSRPPWRGRLTLLRGAPFPQYALPWTDNFPEYFRRINGYDIVDKLPELFFNIGSYTKTRYDYWRTLTMLFIESFSKRIYDWCNANGLRFTGHYLMEDTLLSQLVVGAVMPHYEYMHVPGMDHLCLRTWEMFLTAKQVASVANQLGKERVLSETYGATGHHPTFEDRKWIGDFLYALGINLLNHHLVPYSLRGRRKADYGLTIHWSQPWWPYNKVIEDYFARLSYVLSQGVRLVDVLVLHPIGSVWATYSPVNESEAVTVNEKFMEVLRGLARMHVDFELGDETIMAKYGNVSGGELTIGRARYRVVVIPPSYTIAASTINVLKRFIDNGGLVVAIKPIPTMIDGVESPTINDFLSKVKIVDDVGKLSEILNSVERSIIVNSPSDKDGEVLTHVRSVGGSLIVFIANTSRVKDHEVEVSFKGSFKVEDWDPLTGSISNYPASLRNGWTLVKVTLNPVGSRLLVLKPGEPLIERSVNYVKVGEVKLSSDWVTRRLNPNILVLDYARVKVGSNWSEPMPMPKVKDTILSLGVGSAYTIRFEVNATEKPQGKLSLVVESDNLRRITINGHELNLSKPTGTWLDWNFKTYDVTDLIKDGINIIEVEGIIGLEPDLEPLYLLGEFAVEAKPKGQSIIHREQPVTSLGDLTKQGYPFYSGAVELTRSVRIVNASGGFDKVELILSFNAALAIVYVNGVEVARVIQRNSSVDITKHVRYGDNEIKVTLIGTLGNTLGPLHRKGDLSCVGPETFYIVNESWTDEYVLRPFGLEDARLTLYRIA